MILSNISSIDNSFMAQSDIDFAQGAQLRKQLFTLDNQDIHKLQDLNLFNEDEYTIPTPSNNKKQQIRKITKGKSQSIILLPKTTEQQAVNVIDNFNLNPVKETPIINNNNLNCKIQQNIQICEIQEKQYSQYHNKGDQEFNYVYNFINRIKLLKKFTNIIMSRIKRKQKCQLDGEYLRYIGDVTYSDFQNNAMLNEQIQLFNQLETNLKQKITTSIKTYKLISCKYCKIPVLQPDSLFITLWQCFILLMVISQLFLIPFKLSFQEIAFYTYNNETANYSLNQFPIFVFLCDIIINFNTGYYCDGIIILDRLKIVKNYFKFMFWIDLISTFGRYMASGQFFNQYIDLIFLLRIRKIPLGIKIIDEYYHIQHTILFQISKLIILIFIIAHYCACGFHFVGQICNETTWIQKQGMEDLFWVDRYIISLYFSFITMITVGYGDITPVNIYERLYVILMTLLSCGVFGYAINTIGSIFQEMAQKESQFKQMKSNL